eukprot:COSAG05_NODE_1846_length_3968_cov_36.682605_4_plen_83_part_00
MAHRYIKPLRDGSFAVVLLNKGETTAVATASWSRRGAQSVGASLRNDFRPAGCNEGQVCGFEVAHVPSYIPPYDACGVNRPF